MTDTETEIVESVAGRDHPITDPAVTMKQTRTPPAETTELGSVRKGTAQAEEKNENGTEIAVREEETMKDNRDVIVICSMTEEVAVGVAEKTVPAEKIETNLRSKLAPVEAHLPRNENQLQISRTLYRS